MATCGRVQARVSELSTSWTSWDLREETAAEVRGGPAAQRGVPRAPPYPLRPSVRTQRLALRLQAQYGSRARTQSVQDW